MTALPISTWRTVLRYRVGRDCTTTSRWAGRSHRASHLEHLTTENRVDERKAGTSLLLTNTITGQVVVNIIGTHNAG